MMDVFTVIIPARMASTRLPGKMLLEIAGKPLIQHVYESACRSDAEKIIIATDNDLIFKTCNSFGAECVMTSVEHVSGTDRLAEVVDKIDLPDNAIVVNVQGDELGMPPELINQVAKLLINTTECNMATICEEIVDDRDITDPNVVKVVFSKLKSAIYFSRSPVPWHKEGQTRQYFRHIGIYAYRTGFLRKYSRLPRCELEQKESLEQLRALYYGETILIEEANVPSGIGVDTESDLQRARQLIETGQGNINVHGR